MTVEERERVEAGSAGEARVLERALSEGLIDAATLDSARRLLAEPGDRRTARFGPLLDALVAGGALQGSWVRAALRDERPSSVSPPITRERLETEDTWPPGVEFPTTGWDRYQCQALLGCGGMGRVFKAWDPALRRHVALKFLHRDDPEHEERFVREAQAQARIEHPGVCPVYEVGHVGGYHYIAMRFVAGGTIKQAAAGLSLEQKVVLIREVAEALHAAHRAGLVHRDVKPGNVLVEWGEDGAPRAFVVDFGLARETDAAGMTATGMVVGTAAYMSPEQARGEVRGLDRRTDVYGIGATLYELLTGQPPFPGDARLETILKVIGEEPVPPRRHDRAIPRDLETIVLHCLEKHPQDRYPSASALADDLGRFLDGKPITVAPASPTRRLLRMLRRHRAVTTAAMIAVAVTTVSTAVAGFSVWRARRQARIGQELAADVRFVEDTMAHSALAPLHDTRPERARMRARLDSIAVRVAALGSDAEGPGCYAIGRGHLALGEAEEAHAHLNRAWRSGYRTAEVAESLGRSLATLYERAMESAERLTNAEQRTRRRMQARADFAEPALAFLRRADPAGGEAPEIVAGLIALLEERFEEAGRAAEAAGRRNPWDSEPFRLAGHAQLARGRLQVAAGDYDAGAESLAQAGAAYAEATRIARSDPAGWEAACQQQIEMMGLELRRGGDPRLAIDGALTACGNAIAVLPSAVGPHNRLSSLYWHWADYAADHGDDCRPLLARAIELADTALRLDPGDDVAHFNRGCALYMLGRDQIDRGDDPRATLEGAVAAFQRSLDVNANQPEAFNDMGYALDRLAKHECGVGLDPRPTLERAVAAYRRAIELDPAFANAYNTLGIAYWRRAEYESRVGLDPMRAIAEAEESYRKATSLNPNYAYAWGNLGALARTEARWLIDRERDPSDALGRARAALARSLEINADIYWLYAEMIEVELLDARWRLAHGQPAGEPLARAARMVPQAFAVNPSSAEIHRAAAAVHLWRASDALARGASAGSEIHQGLALVARALEINPRRGDSMLLEAQLRALEAGSWPPGQERTRRTRRALELAERALRLNPLLAGDVAALRGQLDAGPAGTVGGPNAGDADQSSATHKGPDPRP